MCLIRRRLRKEKFNKMNYFDHNYLSNSKLSEFGKEIGLLNNYNTKDPTDNFRLGTLFDYLTTDLGKLDILNNKMIGTDYLFSDDDLKMFKLLHKNLLKENRYKTILSLNPNYQFEIFKENFTLNNETYPVNFKAKLDIFIRNWVIDIKTTKCTTQSQFEVICHEFGYFRQMLFYMNLTGARMSTLVGCSKKNNKIFFVDFSNSHALYNENLTMCKKLLNKYYLLCN